MNHITRAWNLRTLARLIFLLLPLFTSAPCGAATPDQNARFLAGLPTSDDSLKSLVSKPYFTEHASSFQSAWNSFDRRQTMPIHAWQKEQLPSAQPTPRPLIYLFSGPDILHAHAFFPDAPVYVLCGIEPIGGIPEIEKIDPSKVGASLQQIRQSLESVLSWSFFKTKNMKTDLTATPLQGTLPILYLFLARMNCTVESADWVSVDRSGTLVEERVSGSLAPGVRIRFVRAGQTAAQTVYYFSSDLSDGAADKSGFLKWCSSLGPCDAFLKSASYLLHTPSFQYARKFLLEHSERLLQDDSGVPLKHLNEKQWSLRPFGNYPGPITLFKDYPQPELAALYQKHTPSPLPFAFGYQWRPKQSGVVLATRTAPLVDKAEPTPSFRETKPVNP